MTSSASPDDRAVPLARRARSAATTVGSIGNEWTAIPSKQHIAAMRSSVPRKSKALFQAEARSTRCRLR